MRQMGVDSKRLVLGKFAGHFGVRGWLKVVSYTKAYTGNTGVSDPFGSTRPQLNDWQDIEVEQSRFQGNRLIAKIRNIDTREQAEQFLNKEIAICESQLAPLDEGEYYWKELIGLNVVNLADEDMGTIDHILETGGNDVLVLRVNNGAEERLVPRTNDVVNKVDIAGSRMVVDWDIDF